MRRVLAIAAYQQKFNAAFPAFPASQSGFQHAANAIAAFEAQTFTKASSAFDRYLARDDNALSIDAKRGACSSSEKHAARRATTEHSSVRRVRANGGVPQLGPGTGRACRSMLGARDLFRGKTRRRILLRASRRFETSSCARRTCTTARTRRSKRSCAITTTPIRRQGIRSDDARSIVTRELSWRRRDDRESARLDGRATRQPLALTVDEQKQLVVFLKSLTDPAARDLRAVTPSSVPSGLPVKD